MTVEAGQTYTIHLMSGEIYHALTLCPAREIEGDEWYRTWRCLRLETGVLVRISENVLRDVQRIA